MDFESVTNAPRPIDGLDSSRSVFLAIFAVRTRISRASSIGNVCRNMLDLRRNARTPWTIVVIAISAIRSRNIGLNRDRPPCLSLFRNAAETQQVRDYRQVYVCVYMCIFVHSLFFLQVIAPIISDYTRDDGCDIEIVIFQFHAT